MQLQVTENRIESNNYFSIILKKPINFNFYPGQYLDIHLPIKSHSTKPFSISSSPSENYLMITTQLSNSGFKRKFHSLKPGDTIDATHPAGTFTLDENITSVMIAGGVGITPFRSMIKYAVDRKLKTPIILIYSNSTPDFLFKDELDSWQKRFDIHYIVGRITKKDLPRLDAIFYLAGSPKMVGDIKKILMSLGVDEINIRTDEFTGY